MRMFLILMFMSFSTFGAKPSWKVFGLFIDGVKTQQEADALMKEIVAVDTKMIKSAKGLTPESKFVLIDHDHHNVTFQKIAQTVMKNGKYKVSVLLNIPDYKKIQGSLIGKKLNKILAETTKGFEVKTLDAEKGSFEVVFKSGKFEGKGFNLGNLAHPISDPIVFGGLGLNMDFPGKNGKGGMKKDAVQKELAFRKKGKKTKKYSPELMTAYKKFYNFPPEALKEFYK